MKQYNFLAQGNSTILVTLAETIELRTSPKTDWYIILNIFPK